MAKRQYNLGNVMRYLSGDKSVDVGYEKECSRQMEKETGKCARGILLPDAQMQRDGEITSTAGQETFGRPAHGTIDGIGGWGSAAVSTDTLFQHFVEALTAKTVLVKAGAQVLEGLVGDIAIPKGGQIEAAWITPENEDAPKKNPTMAQLLGTPHTVGAYVDVTRLLMNQSGLNMTAYVLRLLQEAISRKVDAAGFGGSGADGEPLGLANVSGVNTVSMVSNKPTRANMVDFWAQIDAANADTENGCYIMHPLVKGLLAKTFDTAIIENKAGTENVGGVAAPRYLVDKGQCEDFKVLTSTLCGAGKIYFGDFSNILICRWRGVDLIADPYTLGTRGGTRLVGFADVDILVRHGAAFSKGTALSA